MNVSIRNLLLYLQNERFILIASHNAAKLQDQIHSVLFLSIRFRTLTRTKDCLLKMLKIMDRETELENLIETDGGVESPENMCV